MLSFFILMLSIFRLQQSYLNHCKRSMEVCVWGPGGGGGGRCGRSMGREAPVPSAPTSLLPVPCTPIKSPSTILRIKSKLLWLPFKVFPDINLTFISIVYFFTSVLHPTLDSNDKLTLLCVPFAIYSLVALICNSLFLPIFQGQCQYNHVWKTFPDVHNWDSHLPLLSSESRIH